MHGCSFPDLFPSAAPSIGAGWYLLWWAGSCFVGSSTSPPGEIMPCSHAQGRTGTKLAASVPRDKTCRIREMRGCCCCGCRDPFSYGESRWIVSLEILACWTVFLDAPCHHRSLSLFFKTKPNTRIYRQVLSIMLPALPVGQRATDRTLSHSYGEDTALGQAAGPSVPVCAQWLAVAAWSCGRSAGVERCQPRSSGPAPE